MITDVRAGAGGTRGDQYVHVGKLKLRVERHGSGFPLLLLNGIGAPIEMWAPLARRLTGREVVMFDLPGSGRSRPPSAPMRMPGFARAAIGVLDELGLPCADVLGYSFGGIVAQEVARRAPNRVRRLILAATLPGIPGIPPNPLAAILMATPLGYYSRTLSALMVPGIAGGRTARDPRALDRDLACRRTSPPSVIGCMHQAFASSGWSSMLWLHQIRQRTLVLHAGHDPVIPLRHARWMARRIPDAQLHVVSRAGHLFLVDEPASVVGRIDDFLAAV